MVEVYDPMMPSKWLWVFMPQSGLFPHEELAQCRQYIRQQLSHVGYFARIRRNSLQEDVGVYEYYESGRKIEQQTGEDTNFIEFGVEEVLFYVAVTSMPLPASGVAPMPLPEETTYFYYRFTAHHYAKQQSEMYPYRFYEVYRAYDEAPVPLEAYYRGEPQPDSAMLPERVKQIHAFQQRTGGANLHQELKVLAGTAFDNYFEVFGGDSVTELLTAWCGELSSDLSLVSVMATPKQREVLGKICKLLSSIKE